jgi:hypothetical protein
MQESSFKEYVQDVQSLFQILSDPRISPAVNLPDTERTIWHLRLIENKTFEQIGLELKEPAHSVRMNFNMAVNRLRHEIIKAIEAYRPVSELLKENKKLRKENQQFKDRLGLTETEPTDENDVDPEVLKLPIQELGLSPRALNVLKEYRIRLVSELVAYDVYDLFKMRNMGAVSVANIENALEKYGLRMNMY